MKKIFGRAADFYRIRLVHVEEVVPPELDWSENILFYPPPLYDSQATFQYRIEVVDTDNSNTLPMAFFAEKLEAEEKFKVIEEDLNNLTKMEFEEKYKITG